MTPTTAKKSLPLDQALLGVLEQVLCDWAFLPADSAGRPGPGPVPLPLEVRMDLSGDREGCLVLRCSQGFGLKLAQGALGEDQASPDQAADALAEICNLVSKHLAGKVVEKLAASVPIPSRPETWPAAEPDAAAALACGAEAFEARLWFWEGPEAAK